ncbi:hypothetical protein FHX37_1999 [Haloactinospora alba]|uniref:Copper(I)-binding protein n=1 Tax=Haloactinospora alba TaxID=405555 RepID=A0A543NJN3_9ACTN|nr:copper chaperone PCu(A)C [Haloactinospora alba]TQN32073.1 hypothetical protein FHX37_1999 [Haloactinospora alba]
MRAVTRMAAAAAAGLVGVLAGCGEEQPDITVTDASVRVPANPDVTAGYLTVRNTGGTDDTLTGVTSDAADEVQMHDTRQSDGNTEMVRQEEVAVGAEETVAFETGGLHLMLMEPGELEAGETVRLSLEFSRSGTVPTEAEVVDPTDPDSGN